MKIIVVEDNPAINNLLVKSLQQKGYETVSFFDGKRAADYIEEKRVDLALLDIMLPEISGEDLIDYFMVHEIPVIFLTAKTELSDKVRGLKLGADDYITKPFELEELFARIETVLRRNKKYIDAELIWKDIRVDTLVRAVYAKEELVSLTPKEYQLFVYFLANKGILLDRATIYESIWGPLDEINTRTVDLHVQRIRNKLHLENELRTVYGVGYVLEE